jgi:lipopolysaccharide assembly outer membrane protein LptD (OstA)
LPSPHDYIDSDTGIERISATLGQRYYFEDQKVFLPGMVTAINRKNLRHYCWLYGKAFQPMEVRCFLAI